MNEVASSRKYKHIPTGELFLANFTDIGQSFIMASSVSRQVFRSKKTFPATFKGASMSWRFVVV